MKTFIIILLSITIVAFISYIIFSILSLRFLGIVLALEDANLYQSIYEPHRIYLKYKMYKKLSFLFSIISTISCFISIVAILLFRGYI